MIRITLENKEYIDVELYPDIAPLSVTNFIKLVDEKYYDGIVFHRIIKDFMAQAGGYKVNGNQLVEVEKGDPIKGEFTENGFENNLLHTKGVISMARTTDPNSATAQFFICTAGTPHLNGKYAAFGKVINEESFKVLENLNNAATINIGGGLTDFPYPVIRIESIRQIS